MEFYLTMLPLRRIVLKRQSFPLHYSRYSPFEVEGLIFSHHPDNLEQHGVFNIHTKTWHAIPPAPKKSKYRSAIGMMVDTSERPYSFKLVVGSLDMRTHIYDSQGRSWSTTSSQLKRLAKPALKEHQVVTCVCSNGCVYISIGTEILLMYSIDRDKWTVMDFPKVKEWEAGGVHALGECEGRIFTAREDIIEKNVTVWELKYQAKEEWVESAVISKEDYSGLMECNFSSYGPRVYEGLTLVPCFCNEYLLIYNWHYEELQSFALGVLNLATKEWEKVDLPPRTVAIEDGNEEGSGSEEGSSNEGGSGNKGGSEVGSGFEGGSGEASDNDEDAEDSEN